MSKSETGFAYLKRIIMIFFPKKATQKGRKAQGTGRKGEGEAMKTAFSFQLLAVSVQGKRQAGQVKRERYRV